MSDLCPTTSKTMHATPGQAHRIAKRLNRGSPRQVSVYLCPSCGAFHVGRKHGRPGKKLRD